MIKKTANLKAQCNPLVSRIRAQLDGHPHFRGRTKLFQIEAIGRSIVVSGRVPTYYLKQLLQEAIKLVPDVTHIDNRVDVTAEYPPQRRLSV